MYRRVLVPLDGSALAERALAHAERIAAPGGELVLFEVLEPEMVMPPMPPGETATVRDAERVAREMREATARARQAAERYLASVKRQVRRSDLGVSVRVEEGQPADRITQAAADADAIAMSTHGRTGLAHLFMGSVAEKVIRHAPVPVLIVGAGPAEGR
ncbi:MAG TPA: universal stress protein [Thermodesulfobacteriota bacterium]